LSFDAPADWNERVRWIRLSGWCVATSGEALTQIRAGIGGTSDKLLAPSKATSSVASLFHRADRNIHFRLTVGACIRTACALEASTQGTTCRNTTTKATNGTTRFSSHRKRNNLFNSARAFVDHCGTAA